MEHVMNFIYGDWKYDLAEVWTLKTKKHIPYNLKAHKYTN
jgi:hypothetical protein